MRQARYQGQLVTAGPDAPRRAECPACREPVALKATGGGWTYYHIPNELLPPKDCPLRARRPGKQDRVPRPDSDPEYALVLAIIRQTILDGLDGEGVEVLEWLFTPLAQAGLGRLLGTDRETTLAATQRAVRRLRELAELGQGHRVRSLLAYRNLAQLQEYFR